MSVVVAYLHPQHVSHSFTDSMIRVFEHEMRRGEPIACRITQMSATGEIDRHRNRLAAHFVRNFPDSEWLWFIDADMGFQPDTLERLLDSADPIGSPVMAGLAPVVKYDVDGFNGFEYLGVRPAFTRGPPQHWGCLWPPKSEPYPADEVIQVGAVGAACMLIHRCVLELIGDDWFSFRYAPDGCRMTEDVSFCWRLAEAGIPIHLNTGVKLTHHKGLWASLPDEGK